MVVCGYGGTIPRKKSMDLRQLLGQGWLERGESHSEGGSRLMRWWLGDVVVVARVVRLCGGVGLGVDEEEWMTVKRGGDGEVEGLVKIVSEKNNKVEAWVGQMRLRE
ncbi:unnamed protein product [Sphenostylis stenocarpa]|uniref:Uncharacterized protein n=1 Tax=Sphenostylis stenocarpa TaxID=92480 RepID=A0AA86T216_9FABA|nr:unnamed protein product [Sphenostylis stenocarpa]